MKAKQINKIIDYGVIATAAYFVGSAIFGAIKRKKEGVGKVERIKRRIYKEVSLAQDAGVDFSKKYAELTADEKKALEHVGKDVVGWKQSKRSIESGKPYTESYFGSLRRAWNNVSGIEGIGRAYNVKDANGNICLTWIEDAAAHVEAEKRTLEAEERAAQARKRLQQTRRALQRQSAAPVAPVVDKSKQQQILDKVPYLRIMDDPFHPISNSTDFGYVLWKKAKDYNGDVQYEGAAMAFRSLAAANDAKDFLKRVAPSRTDEWQDFWDKQPYNSNFFKEKETAQLSIIPANKVNIDKISGIGYAAAQEPFWYGIPSVQFIYHGEWADPEIYYRGKYYNASDAEEELYAIWREQIEYGETEKDFDAWMRSVGGDYLKSDVLPYMTDSISYLFLPGPTR